MITLVTAGSVQAESFRTLMSEYVDIAPSYQYQAIVQPESLVVPTVVELPIPILFDQVDSFAVYEQSTDRFIPSYLDEEALYVEDRRRIVTEPVVARADSMIDRSLDTYADFGAGERDKNTVTLTLYTTEPITTESVRLLLSPQVADPLTVAVRTGVDDRSLTRSIVERRYSSSVITFPRVTASVFEITLTHIQPLRIADIRVQPFNRSVTEDVKLRFLAQPNSTYMVFAQSENPVFIDLGEAGDLRSNTDVVALPAVSFTRNSLYVPADVDQDGVPDTTDNCVAAYNPDQADINDNRRGDVCDDFDRDGVSNQTDNCPNEPNRRQRDEDGDGIGDVCDTEESRLTEQNPWTPWVGMSMAGVTILVLFVLVARQATTQAGRRDDNETQDHINSD